MHIVNRQGIIHRDLKLENVLFENATKRIVIIDFDLCAEVKKCCDVLSRNCGSFAYCAPQVILDSPYRGCSADCWSFGICVFAFISQRFPFDEKEQMLFTTFYRNSNVQFHTKMKFSGTAQDLIKKCTIECDLTRIHFQEVIKHPSFKNKVDLLM